MKKNILTCVITLSIMLLCLCLLPTKVQAASESDLTFESSEDGASYSVKKCNSSASGSLTIPATHNGKPVTSVGRLAFRDCTNLTSIIIPDSFTSIGNSAFTGCTGLTSITIPDSVTSIDYHAFSGCAGLTSVTIPNSVTSIGANAFIDCTGLTEVHITDIVAWCKISFSDNPVAYGAKLYLNGELVTELTIPDGVTSIAENAFFGCTDLTSVTIPNSVTSVGRWAFYDCTNLTSIIIPDSFTSIGDYAFAGCKGLTSITIPNSVTSISECAFSSCIGLTSVTIPNSVTSIGSKAFNNCTGLTSITISDSVSDVDSKAFNNCKIKELIVADGSKTVTDKMVVCRDTLEKAYLPQGIELIAEDAFSKCTALKQVYYGGSPKEWEAVKKYSGNDRLSDVEIICAKTDPTTAPTEKIEPTTKPTEKPAPTTKPTEKNESITKPTEETGTTTESTENTDTTADSTLQTDPSIQQTDAPTGPAEDKTEKGNNVVWIALGSMVAGIAIAVAGVILYQKGLFHRLIHFFKRIFK